MSGARPLWQWLAWRFALVGMLPLLLVAVLGVWVLLPQVRAGVETNHQGLARAIAGQVEAHLLGGGRELSALAAFLGQRDGQPASFWFDPLDAHAGTGDVFAAIYIVDVDDSLYAVGLPQGLRGQRNDLLNMDLSRWAVVREAREHQQVLWSEVFLSAVSARLTVSLAIPVGEQLLIGEVAIDRLSAFLGRLPGDSGMLTMIFDRRGQVIAQSQPRFGGQQLNLGHLPIVERALQGQLATGQLELDGETYIGTPVSVPQLGWTVLVAQTRGEALGPLLSTFWVVAAGGLVALLLAAAGTLLLARALARRIGSYTEQAHALADGDYDQPWPASNIREFHRLADDLDRMSLAIRLRERQLATSEARYRSVISSAPVVIFQFDARGVFSLSEGKGLASVGLVPGEARGISIFELYRDYPEICEHARRAIGGEAVHYVARVGDTVFDTYMNPVRDHEGSVQVMGVAVDISERMRVEEELRQANVVVENSAAMLFRWRAEPGWPAVFVSHNVRQLGYSADELLDGSVLFGSLIHPDDVDRVAGEVQGYADSGTDRFVQEYRIVTRDGRVRWVDDRTVAERNAAGQISHYQGIVIDISERKRAEEALRHVNRQLRMISDCNQALIRSTDESDLLHTVCGIVVQVGGYRMAWVGYAQDDAARTVRPVACAGYEDGYLETLNTSWADDERGQSASGRAIRSGLPCMIPDIVSDPGLAPWHAQAVERGYGALCALPLQAGGLIFGALSIYASALDAFDADEVDLLNELAGDLAFGINVMRTRKERELADQALRESEQLLRRSQEVGDLGSYYFDTRSATWISSEKLDRILGIDDSFPKTVDGWMALVHRDEREEVVQHLSNHVLAEHNRFDREYRIVRHDDGQERWVHGLGELEFDADGAPVKMIGTIQDITQSRLAEQALHESEARYRLLFDSNPHPMWVYDLQTLAFLTVNDAAVSRYGYSRDEFMSMTIMDIRPSEDIPLLLEDIVAVDEGIDYAGFWRHLTKDGTLIDVEIISHTLSYQGRPAELVLANDITERRRSEQALLQSELNYRELVENANSIILRWNQRGEITFINEFGLKFFGYTEDELLGQHVVGTIVPGDGSNGTDLRPLMDEICAEPKRFEHNINENMRRGGERVWVSWTNKAILDASGQVVEVFSVGSDITERKRAEAALRESEERFAKAFHVSPAPMSITPIDSGRFLDVNAQLERMFGYTRKELIGRTSTELGLWADPGQRARMIAQLRVDGFFREAPTQFVTRTGDIRDTLWSGEIIRLGNEDALLSLIFDVTERKRAEAALRESEARFATAFRASPAPMAITEIDSGRFLDVNAQLMSMFGYAREEMVGQTSTAMGIWADPGHRDRMIAKLRAEGFVREAPTRFATRSGDIREALWSGEVIRVGEQDALLSLIYDITDRKRAEHELQRYREHLEELVGERTSDLQRANEDLRQAMVQLVQAEKLAALGNLVAGVAHELNTPLGNTRVVASLLAEQLREFALAIESGSVRRSQVDTFLSRGREAVDLLERNSARAADLIGHFKQVAVDQSSARRRSFDLRQTIDEMLAALRPSFKGSRHRIDVDIPPGLELDSYPGPLEQVLGNLVSNSLTHGFSGVDEGRIELHAEASGPKHIVLRCTDNGVGIPEATINRIFEPFFTTRLGQGGSGLGLYIVYNLVTGVLGGTIEAASPTGEGTIFTLTLPRCAPERPASG
ncbi:multi-sensor signal transduction histidine kinase [Candidatus Accumulibacter phosphatis]|uniref:histidine kinase n=1 Tax=Accumulibacter regalis TaxID=522306 RepID=C7RP22_ACCRE